MKKIMYLITVVLFPVFTIISCRSDDNNSQATLQGNWQPDKLVVTQTNGSASNMIITNTCQKSGRIIFSTSSTGHILLKDDSTGNCVVTADADFTYTYNPSTKDLSITTQGVTTNGKVVSLSQNQLIFYYFDASGTKFEFTLSRV